jgi:hypothetical protein
MTARTCSSPLSVMVRPKRQAQFLERAQPIQGTKLLQWLDTDLAETSNEADAYVSSNLPLASIYQDN